MKNKSKPKKLKKSHTSEDNRKIAVYCMKHQKLFGAKSLLVCVCVSMDFKLRRTGDAYLFMRQMNFVQQLHQNFSFGHSHDETAVSWYIHVIYNIVEIIFESKFISLEFLFVCGSALCTRHYIALLIFLFFIAIVCIYNYWLQ